MQLVRQAVESTTMIVPRYGTVPVVLAGRAGGGHAVSAGHGALLATSALSLLLLLLLLLLLRRRCF